MPIVFHQLPHSLRMAFSAASVWDAFGAADQAVTIGVLRPGRVRQPGPDHPRSPREPALLPQIWNCANEPEPATSHAATPPTRQDTP